jgi:hypothetical protein
MAFFNSFDRLRSLGALSRAGLTFLLLFPVLTGCGSLNAYRTESVLLQSRFTTIENYAISEIDPREVDDLLLQVAEILGVQLDPTIPKPRIVVTTSSRIASLYSSASVAFPGHVRAAALYFPGANLVMIPHFDRIILGHELAHYITDHYLKAPRPEWEEIAHRVEWKLLMPPRPVKGDASLPAGEGTVTSQVLSDRRCCRDLDQ